MREFLYNIGIRIYWLSAIIISPFNQKARKFISGRKESRAALNKRTKTSEITIWIHCSSLGEFEQGRPLIDHIKENYQEIELVLTFFSPSGYEIRQNYPHVDFTSYLLLDTPSNMLFMVDKIKPDLVILVKYEFWHNLINTLHKHNIPIISVSAKFRENQQFFKSIDNFFNKMLRKFDHIFTQDEESKQLLESINIPVVTVAGDTRYDRVVTMAREPYKNKILEKFANQKPIMVVGSCWPADLDILYSFIQQYNQQINFLIAPHELNERSYQMIEEHFPNQCVRYSDISNEVDLESYNIIILDIMGELSYMYRYGKYAFVGGAFGRGLHNILEPACYGLPVFFGNKNYQKFNEANNLVKIGGGYAIGNTSELIDNFSPLLNESTYLIISESITQFVKTQEGASNRIHNYLEKLLLLK